MLECHKSRPALFGVALFMTAMHTVSGQLCTCNADNASTAGRCDQCVTVDADGSPRSSSFLEVSDVDTAGSVL